MMESSMVDSDQKKKRINLIHIIATNFYGGPEKQIIEHLKRLPAKDYNVSVLSFKESRPDNEFLDKARQENIPVIEVPMSGPFDVSALRKLIRELRQANIHIACLHGYKAAVMGAIACKLLRISAVVFSRGYTAENVKVSFYEKLERLSLKYVKGVVAVSNGQLRKLKNYGVRFNKYWVVHNAVNTEIQCSKDVVDNAKIDLCSSLGIDNGAKLLVSAGRLSPEKGHRYLIEAFAKISNDRSDVYLLICGEGPCLENLKHQAIELSVNNRVLFLGFRKDMQNVYSAMDLFVLPSLTEGLPNVVLESFAFGKTVVATAVGGVPELVKHKKNGYLVEPGNVNQMTQAITECLRDDVFLERMGVAAYKTVKEEFDFESQSEKLIRVYNEVLA
jgi:glycosyltransferase involved in cell wall biosynthesis